MSGMIPLIVIRYVLNINIEQYFNENERSCKEESEMKFNHANIYVSFSFKIERKNSFDGA